MTFSLDIDFLGQQNLQNKLVYFYNNNFIENLYESWQPLMPLHPFPVMRDSVTPVHLALCNQKRQWQVILVR